MVYRVELDLVGVFSPVCLLKCKSGLQAMNPGQVLDVRIQDPEVVGELVRIVGRSADEVVEQKMEGATYRVRIRKGARDATPGWAAKKP